MHITASAAALLCACFVGGVAQAEVEPASASAVTLRRLSLVKLNDLEFGGIIPGTAVSRVTINASTDARTTTGNALLVGSNYGAARFVSYGGPNLLVTMGITGPAPTLTRVGGTQTMVVDQMTFNGPTLRILNTAGFMDIRVGGRLTVNANQAAGQYTGTFQVTINYL